MGFDCEQKYSIYDFIQVPYLANGFNSKRTSQIRRDTDYGHNASSLFQGLRDILLKAKQNFRHS